MNTARRSTVQSSLALTPRWRCLALAAALILIAAVAWIAGRAGMPSGQIGTPAAAGGFDLGVAGKPKPTGQVREFQLVAKEAPWEIAPGVTIPAITYDGQVPVQGGQWLAMNPTAPAELARQGNWGELARAAQAMQHGPSRARATDLEALRWAGLAMRAEGQAMTEHGRVMLEETDVIVTRHDLTSQAAADLRQAARTMSEVADILTRDGQIMINYAEQLRRSLGHR